MLLWVRFLDAYLVFLIFKGGWLLTEVEIKLHRVLFFIVVDLGSRLSGPANFG